MSVEYTELRPGHQMSRILKGGWQLGGDHGPVDPAQAIADMEAFIDAGITTFDCADIYKGVEEMIGTFIADLRNRRGAEVADQVVVHTKLVPDLTRLADLRPDEVQAIVDRSLQRLKIDQIPLVQFFWWDMALGNAVEALEVLKDCQKQGKIANLGTTNWDADVMDRFIDAGYDIASTQVQYSLLDRRAEGRFADWGARRDVKIISFGVLAGGFLTDAWLGKADPGYQFENRSLIKYRLIIDEFGPWDLFQALLQTLRGVADRHTVSVASVATRWILDQPQVAGAIIGARYARHLPQTLEAFGFALDASDRAAIDAVLAQAAGPNGPIFGLEGDRSGRHGRIMKYNLNTNPSDKVLAG